MRRPRQRSLAAKRDFHDAQAITPLAIEGLTGDSAGNLYTTGRAASPALCPVWRITGTEPDHRGLHSEPARPAILRASPSMQAAICTSPTRPRPALCGRLLQAPTRLRQPQPSRPACREPTASPSIATATSGPVTARPARAGCGKSARRRRMRAELHRMRGGVPHPADAQQRRLGGASRRRRRAAGADFRPERHVTVQPATPTTPRGADSWRTASPSQRDGDLYVADTARGAIWKVEFHRRGN